MKPKLNSLLGAALCLLMTLTTAHAAGKGNGGGGNGGGGGPDAGPGGTIYYYDNFPDFGGGIPTISMNPDGSNKTVLGSGGWKFLVFTGQSFESSGINHDIFVMHVNGGDLVNLTQTPGPASERTFSGHAGWR